MYIHNTTLLVKSCHNFMWSMLSVILAYAILNWVLLDYVIIMCSNLDGFRNQLCPRYEGQLILMAEPIPHPKRPPLTPSQHSSFFASDGRAETDS